MQKGGEKEWSVSVVFIFASCLPFYFFLVLVAFVA